MSRVDLCNEALMRIGALTIESLDDPSREARSCKRLYESTLNTLLSGFRWSFAHVTKRLHRIDHVAEGIVTEYPFVYQMPTDWVMTISVNNLNFITQITPPMAQPMFEMRDGRMHSHWNVIYLHYVTKRHEPHEMPHYFRELFVAELAYALTTVIILDSRQVAQLYAIKQEVEGRAKTLDLNTAGERYEDGRSPMSDAMGGTWLS